MFNNNDQIRIVVGLNQVDKLVANGWDEKLNTPTIEAEKEIERRCQDIINKLAKFSDISTSHIEYYSALKRYRLINLLSKIIKYADAGFKLDNVNPADPFELADPEVQKFVEKEREKRKKEIDNKTKNKEDEVLEKIESILSPKEIELIKSKLTKEKSKPPKIAVVGKSGVGKSTTINNLFNAQLVTSHTTTGTKEAITKEFELPTGGTLSIIDLPGYGQSIEADKKYDEIYKNIIPSCDLLLLVIQANTRDFSDDQEFIIKVKNWLKNNS